MNVMDVSVAYGDFGDTDEEPMDIIIISKMGGRGLGSQIAEINLMRYPVVLTHDKARIGVLMPMPKDRTEVFEMLKQAPSAPTARALRTEIRNRLIKGEVIGVGSGRMRSHKNRHPDAILAPFPHTVVLADWIADKVMEAIGTL